ncbi:hypothetical protein EI77_04710 [Prosthecobacter fusiformis]|uniref:EF hand domain-containing protein n=1 Tax=Prosthecobacter fusiformis TaxID=48464 RepID=A0A4R7RJL3_9BACT|nr:hypothetical protein [Prosthecobacter fusiformis]TDU62486.1 hypothetical protein EI77_04710 [Prosthecobacter fusiformis]
MKSVILHTTLFLAFTALTEVRAAEETPDENKDTNRRHMKGNHEREANAKTALNFVASQIATNPQGLFTRLDHDENGSLSLEEFKRMVNIGSQGAASIEGTKGTTASGAAGSTGITGATAVSGQAMPGQTPVAYGQKADVTGQQPAPGQQPNNKPVDAAAAGQQPMPSAAKPANEVSGQDPKPAPGQMPAAGDEAPDSPTTKNPQ